MNSRICEMLDIEFPLVAFTHCRDVVVAVSKAGGFDTYLWMKYLDPIRIPDHFYYSASYSNYQELDYPIAIFNKGYSDGLEKEEIYSTVPWTKKYI